MGILKRKQKKSAVHEIHPDWHRIDSVAKKIYSILSEEKKITFLEIDVVLQLIKTECDANKYKFLLAEKTGPILIPVGSDVEQMLKEQIVSGKPADIYG